MRDELAGRTAAAVSAESKPARHDAGCDGGIQSRIS